MEEREQRQVLGHGQEWGQVQSSKQGQIEKGKMEQKKQKVQMSIKEFVAFKGIRRDSNMELLRILAMVLIIAHHFANHSLFDFPADHMGLDIITINRLWVQFLYFGGKVGVNLFLLISGYFLVMESSVRAGKILRLWCQIFFYSVVLYLFFAVAGLSPFGFSGVLWCLTPITHEGWWFASTYFILYLLSPYLSKLLRSLTREEYLGLLALVLVLWCVLPTVTHKAFQSNDLLWFMVVYSIGGYVRLHGESLPGRSRRWMVLSVAGYGLVILSFLGFDLLGQRLPFFATVPTCLSGMEKIPVVVISVLIFLGFARLRIGTHKWVNFLASATFGIYLIHDSDLVRPLLWMVIFPNAGYYDRWFLIPYSLWEVVAVFAYCGFLELSRAYLLERRYLLVLNRFASSLDGAIGHFKETLRDCFSKDKVL